MNELYETKISAARWIVYDILGNAGWIIWCVCTVLCLVDGVTWFSILSVAPVMLILIGIGELVSERVAKLDRVLPQKRLYRGFGALTLAGLIGIPIAVIGVMVKENGSLPNWMFAGAVLCSLFAWLLFVGFHKQ